MLQEVLMFHKLHLQLTFFCTVIIGGIFLVLTSICLFFAEDSMKTNDYSAFLQQINSALIHLKEQETISHQWLNQFQKNNQFLLYLYDNNRPLYYQSYHPSKRERQIQKEALKLAQEKYQMDLFSCNMRQITTHTEFNFSSSDRQGYYASAGIIPKKKGSQLSYLILCPLVKQQKQAVHLRLIIFLADLAAISLLIPFFWFFTRRMLTPLEKSREKQMHFIASASHELRAPLTIISAGLDVLKKTSEPGKKEHFMGLMEEESRRMQSLINDMLLLANADSGHLPMHMQPWLPDELLLNAYEKYESLAAKKNIALSIKLPGETLPNCYCDRERMIQVFSVLLDNALSYTPAGGKTSLTLSLHKSCLRFSICDTGCGIPEQEKKLVFDRFYRSDHAHSDKMHFGLGLCIAKEIVSAHHGKIRVENAPEGGSCFVVELPADTPQNHQ